MLSRRNVRIKVMQSIYNWFLDKELSEAAVVRSYKRHISTSYELLIFNLRNIIRISQIAVQDQNWRKDKFLPTESDRNFRPMLYDNPVLRAMESNETYQKYNKDRFNQFIDASQIRKLYLDFSRTEAYSRYLEIKSPEISDHEDILLELWKFLLNTQLYIELVYDAYPCWIDDDSLIKGFIRRLIRGILSDPVLLQAYQPDEETVTDFGQTLLEEVLSNFSEYDQKLIPYLQNWELDRIATVDRILIKMALAEFTQFPSIPTKVTLNEYVEIAKMYSTNRSKEFLNGILDALLQDLIAANEVRKSGRGLIQ